MPRATGDVNGDGKVDPRDPFKSLEQLTREVPLFGIVACPFAIAWSIASIPLLGLYSCCSVASEDRQLEQELRNEYERGKQRKEKKKKQGGDKIKSVIATQLVF
tara:strand:+ start:583 stop:894 length:312 start_codon:yes stop_codon:yes gene_type:complete